MRITIRHICRGCGWRWSSRVHSREVIAVATNETGGGNFVPVTVDAFERPIEALCPTCKEEAHAGA